MIQRKSAKPWIIGAIVVIVIVALVAWWYFSRLPGVDFSRHGPAPSRLAVASTAPPPIAHPISKAQTAPPAPASSVVPLPPLNSSGKATISALDDIPGAKGVAGLLLARGLIPHIVATVDALPRHEIGSSILPARTPSGSFKVSTANGKPVIDPENYARYAPYMKIIKNVDARTLVTWYVNWYPLFQQAYQQLGYPHRYFNDRVIAAINDMLAAPNASSPVAVVATSEGHYAFADPTWEGLSVGQKLMIRVGPNNERALKIKLRRIRALLLGKAAVLSGHASAPATSGTQPAPAHSS